MRALALLALTGCAAGIKGVETIPLKEPGWSAGAVGADGTPYLLRDHEALRRTPAGWQRAERAVYPAALTRTRDGRTIAFVDCRPVFLDGLRVAAEGPALATADARRCPAGRHAPGVLWEALGTRRAPDRVVVWDGGDLATAELAAPAEGSGAELVVLDAAVVDGQVTALVAQRTIDSLSVAGVPVPLPPGFIPRQVFGRLSATGADLLVSDGEAGAVLAAALAGDHWNVRTLRKADSIERPVYSPKDDDATAPVDETYADALALSWPWGVYLRRHTSGTLRGEAVTTGPSECCDAHTTMVWDESDLDHTATLVLVNLADGTRRERPVGGAVDGGGLQLIVDEAGAFHLFFVERPHAGDVTRQRYVRIQP